MPLQSQRYEVETLQDAIELYYRRGWTDGLPVIPPTEERVMEFLEYCGHDPQDIIGVVPERGRTITAEKVAINAIMAGCLPAYAPVVISAVEAATHPDFNLHGSQNSTGGAAMMIVVNGSAVQELKFGTGVNALASTNRVNATVGRALRLVVMNVCGGRPGIFDKSTLGWPGDYSFCVAENESCVDWAPLHVERGMPPDVSAVTVFAAESPHQVSEGGLHEPEPLLDRFAGALRAASPPPPWVGCFGLVMCPEHARVLAGAGWSKRQVREYLASKLESLESADDVLLLVAGGEAGGFSAIVPPWLPGKRSSQPVTRPVGVCVDCEEE
ncbi:MAG TPA: hypothetical protein VF157_07765 [Chloroflexota bacterium]